MATKSQIPSKTKPRPATVSDKVLRYVEKAAEGLRFRNGQFEGMSVCRALTVLAKGERSFFGHEQVLFAGLCAWLAQSSSQSIVADAMIYEAFRIYADEERRQTPDRKNMTLLTAPLATSVALRELLFKIYHPMGGASAVRQMYDRLVDNQRRITGGIPQIKYLISVGRVLHFHALKLSTEPYIAQRSYLYAAEAVGKLGSARSRRGRANMGERQIRTYWSEHSIALPLWYAASLLTAKNGMPLHELIFRCLTSSDVTAYEIAKPLFTEWAAYNEYLVSHVFQGMPLAKGAQSSFPRAKVEERAPPEPSFGVAEIELIRYSFRKRPKDTSPLA